MSDHHVTLLCFSSQDQTVQVTTLQKQNNQLHAELEEAKNVQRKQDTLIQSLKEVSRLGGRGPWCLQHLAKAASSPYYTLM